MEKKMTKNVLVALADKKFLDYAKQLFSTVYWNSGWCGDYLLLAYDTPEQELTWFKEKGIIIKHCTPVDCGSEKLGDKICACKYYMFTEFFKQWDNVVYLDVDIITHGSIEDIAHVNVFSACQSLGQTLRNNIIDQSLVPVNKWTELSRMYDLDKKAFNAGVMAFPTSIIYNKMFEDVLIEIRKNVGIARFGGDQLAINLFFYDRWKELPPVFNEIASVTDTKLNKSLLYGVVIHCVLFGSGPWDKNCVVHEEWKQNYNRADLIDLKNRPIVQNLSKKELNNRCRSVIYLYLLGDKVCIASILKFLLKGFTLALKKPSRFSNKLYSLFKNFTQNSIKRNGSTKI
jgi:lipopolysaccharide biosynthesis glycosyltransferase